MKADTIFRKTLNAHKYGGTLFIFIFYYTGFLETPKCKNLSKIPAISLADQISSKLVFFNLFCTATHYSNPL